MKELIAKFSALKPQERRFVIGFAVAVFVVVNYMFVWPYWGQLGRQKKAMETAQDKLIKYKTELARTNGYGGVIKNLTESEPDVQAEDQDVHFDAAYRDRAVVNKVLIISSGKPSINTNEFFIKHEVGINVQAKEEDLVNFLYSLGSGGSMISVKAVGLHPDPSHQQLAAGITIVASFKRTRPGPVPVARPATTAAATPLPTTKPKTPAAPPPPDKSKNAAANKPAGARAPITNKTVNPNLLKRP